MSKVNINTQATAEQVAEAEQLFNIKSAEGEFIDVTDNFDDAKVVADKNPGASVYKDDTDEVLYTSESPVVDTVAVAEETVAEEVVEEQTEEAPVEEAKEAEPETVVEEKKEETIVKKQEKPRHTKSCVQVVSVDDVIKTVEPEVEHVSSKIVMPGMQVKLTNNYLYKTAHIPQPFKLFTGTVFVFDAKLINGRYRVTNNVNNCGGDIKTVIGYIPAEYI